MQPLLRPEDIYNGKPRKVQLSLRKIQDDVNDDSNAPTNANEEENKYVSQVCLSLMHQFNCFCELYIIVISYTYI